MLNIIIQENLGKSDRDILHQILVNQHFIISKLTIMSNEAQELQDLVAQLKAGQAALKTSLDSVKAGVATIVAGIPAGGLTADEVTALKASITDALTAEQANVAEAADDAAAVAAAQPTTPTTPTTEPTA